MTSQGRLGADDGAFRWPVVDEALTPACHPIAAVSSRPGRVGTSRSLRVAPEEVQHHGRFAAGRRRDIAEERSVGCCTRQSGLLAGPLRPAERRLRSSGVLSGGGCASPRAFAGRGRYQNGGERGDDGSGQTIPAVAGGSRWGAIGAASAVSPGFGCNASHSLFMSPL